VCWCICILADAVDLIYWGRLVAFLPLITTLAVVVSLRGLWRANLCSLFREKRERFVTTRIFCFDPIYYLVQLSTSVNNLSSLILQKK